MGITTSCKSAFDFCPGLLRLNSVRAETGKAPKYTPVIGVSEALLGQGLFSPCQEFDAESSACGIVLRC